MIDKMGRSLRHAPGVAGGTHTAPLAGKRDQEIVTAVITVGAGEPVGQNAAFEVATESLFHMGWNGAPDWPLNTIDASSDVFVMLT